jgi:hypothetical protein
VNGQSREALGIFAMWLLCRLAVGIAYYSTAAKSPTRAPFDNCPSARSLAVLPWAGGEVAARAHCNNVDDVVMDGMLVIDEGLRCAAS